MNRTALPHARDPAVDFYRVVAIAIVVMGHWLAASIVFQQGRFSDDVLTAIPWARWLTLLFQVIPVFFLVAGFGGAASWQSWHGRWHGWFAHRLAGLLGPLTAYIVAALGAVVILRLSGVDPDQLRYGAWAVALHLWFLPVVVTSLLYLGGASVIALVRPAPARSRG